MAFACPNDTDGDGDCGNRRCRHCGGDGSLLAIHCRLCNGPTMMRGTKLCDSCWQLERSIHGNPELARKVLEALDASGS